MVAKPSRHSDVASPLGSPPYRLGSSLAKWRFPRQFYDEANDSESGDSDVQDFKDLGMIFELARLEQQQQEEAEWARHRNYIYRERVEAEARLMADYFGHRPKYPDYYFRLRYRMSRKLFLDIVSGIENYIETHHLADDIYPQWASFVKSFTVASSDKNVLYKRKQEGA
ncbi:ALP1-like protein [Tanacetum coccineum]